MSLNSIVDHRYTDKNTAHSYLDIYDALFSPVRTSATRILEVGVDHGGSIDLWSKYFTNAEVVGVDSTLSRVVYDFSTNPKVSLFTQNAYDTKFVESLGHGTFDIVIDDGPHTHQSMKDFASMYSKLLKPSGILVIEDIQSSDWIPSILSCLPFNMQKNVVVYDVRHIKGRYDDILIVAINELPKT